jgi:hypothetical protein
LTPSQAGLTPAACAVASTLAQPPPRELPVRTADDQTHGTGDRRRCPETLCDESH